MPTRIEPMPITGPFHLELTMRSPHGEVRRDVDISDAYFAVGGVNEHHIAYETAKLGKQCFRNVTFKRVKEMYADKDERMQGFIARATWDGRSFDVPTAAEALARRDRVKRIEKTLWYSVWWTVLQGIHATRFWKDKIMNGVLAFWLRIDPSSPRF